jgi:fatty acid desaturase
MTAPTLERPSADRPRSQRAQSLFAELQREVASLGLMRRRYGHYTVKLVTAPLVLIGLAAAMVLLGDSWWQLLVAGLMGLMLAQVAFLGHDAAHRQIFVSGARNDWAAMLVVGLLSGMSHSWWTGKHTRHHGAPNQLGRDDDIESDVVAYHASARDGRPGLGKWLARKQGYYFFGLLALEGFALHANSIKWLCNPAANIKRRRVELALISARIIGSLAFVFAVMPWYMALAFIGVQVGVFGYYLGASFAPNHIGMPLVPEMVNIDFLRRQVLMSRNIRGGRFMDLLLGGLNHQIEHHLFPNMARPNLRRVKPLVRDFCLRHNIHYTETGLMQSYAHVASYLNRVGLGARDVFVCPLVAAYRPAR